MNVAGAGTGRGECNAVAASWYQRSYLSELCCRLHVAL